MNHPSAICARGRGKRDPQTKLDLERVWRGLRRRLRRVYAVRWKMFPLDYTRTLRLRANGFLIVVLPTVFPPLWHRTSLFLAESCRELLADGHADVLEIGCGSGLVSLSAARHVSHVVATDINPAAVRSTRLNADINGLSAKVETLEGDMFEPVGKRRFDTILCNPPYFKGVPKSDVEGAYLGGEHLEWITRFAHDALSHLREDGRVVCVFGDAADVGEITGLIEREGWAGRVVKRRTLLLEELTVWEFRPIAGGLAFR